MDQPMTTALTSVDCTEHDRVYPLFRASIQTTFEKQTTGRPTLFRVEQLKHELFNLFLDHLPVDRQVHNCNTCRQFVDTYGSLVTIDDQGQVHSVLWDPEETPEFYRPAIAALKERVEKGRVCLMFYTTEPQWGTPGSWDSQWTHMAVTPSKELLSQHLLKTPFQLQMDKLEEYKMLTTALGKYRLDVIDKAKLLLTSETLPNSVRCVGVACWFFDIATAWANEKNEKVRQHRLWKAVAEAPAGFCHISSSMLGTLLDDLTDNLSIESITRRFADKTDATVYMRPQVAPTAENIAQAEMAFAKLGAANSLKRRYARLDELQAIWKPIKEPEEIKLEGSIFGHLVPKTNTPKENKLTLPLTTMTWEKFERKVLPEAKSIYFSVPSLGQFMAFTTAEDPTAPPIFQWDEEDQRNPVSMYQYASGSPAQQWHLQPGTYVPVTAIIPAPWMWNDRNVTNNSSFIAFLLKDAHDAKAREIGSGLFPQYLKSIFHPYRATIEAFSASARLGNPDENTGSGIVCGSREGRWAQCHLRVVNLGGHTADYHIDRWD